MKFYFKDAIGYDLSDRKNAAFIENISKFNVFLGANNSGKSRFMRNVFSDHLQSSIYFFLVHCVDADFENEKEIGEYNNYVSGEYRRFFRDLSLYKTFLVNGTMTKTERNEVFSNAKTEVCNYICGNGNINSKLVDLLRNNQFKFFNDRINKFFTVDDEFLLYYPVNRTFKNLLYYKDSFHFSRQHNFKEFKLENIKKAFIEDVSVLEEIDYDDVIKHKFIDDYFKGHVNFSHFGYDTSLKNYSYKANSSTRALKYGRFTRENAIISGGSLYYFIKNILLGTVEDRRRYEDFQKFLSINFFSSKPINIIPNEKKKTVMMKIGDEKERKISDYGDGIQQVILILLPLYMRKNDVNIAFIEEPELYLHPTMQRDMINIMIQEFPRTLFFITSHSGNFLDILVERNECSIFRFSQNNERFTVSESESNQLKLLNSIGVQPSSIFISNSTIWVEGITDLIHIRSLLKIYMSESETKYVENKHYSIQTYGGSNYKNYNFNEFHMQLDKFNASGISNSVLIISDADDKDNKKSKELKEKYGDKYYELTCRTIDNSISQKVFNEVLNDILKTDIDFNVKSVSYMRNNKKMGEYLNDYINPILEKNDKKTRVFTDENNNLKNEYKRKIAESFDKLSSDLTFNDLSAPATKLVNAIVKFIRVSNSHI